MNKGIKINNKKFQIYFATAIIIIALIILSGCVATRQSTSVSTDNTPSINVTSSATDTVGATSTPTTNITVSQTSVIKCELCHLNPQNYTPHFNGGKLCINCHGSQVHNIHIGQGTVDLKCETCHGFPPTIPTILKNGTGPGSYSICERCHAPPPDSLKPSYGNLIVIHLSRGKYCTNCHGTDLQKIHALALNKTNASIQS